MKKRAKSGGKYTAVYGEKPEGTAMWEAESWFRRKTDMGPQTLRDVCETCQMEGVRAKLYDRAGFLRGSVSPDGSYRLT